MTASLWATVGVSVVGICAGIAIWLISRIPQPEDARAELDRGLGLIEIAMISGGTGRAVDAQVVDLVERGLLCADGGRLSVSGLSAPEGDYVNAITLSAVAEGADSLDSLRGGVGEFGRFTTLLRLTRRRLIISPDRVEVAPAMLWAPTMAVLFLYAIGGMLSQGTAVPELPRWVAPIVSIGACVVVPLVQLWLWCLQPGYRGPDPRSRLGHDVIDQLAAAVGPGTSQAQRVAVGGFAAMTDPALRQAIMGTASDSRWDARPWRKRVFRANAENRYQWTP